MNDALDILPGEGETKTVVRLRRKCALCLAPAKYKHTFLLDNARHNPASTAYKKDDCSWCEDDFLFVCEEHKKELSPEPGYWWCSTFPANERFAHMFLYWSGGHE